MTTAQPQRIHEGKLAIVTGSARSIGAAIVRNLASKGCNVVINHATASSTQAAADLKTELEREHRVRALAVQADISKADECARLVAAARETFGDGDGDNGTKFQIDILVHNAAIVGALGPLETTRPEDFHEIYAVNVLGPTLLTGACLPYLPTDRSGRIVMMSSINPKIGTPHTSLYSGTKAAVEALARVWCRELSERATVNTVNPGPVMTDMYLSAPDAVKEGLAAWNAVTPLVKVRDSDSPEVRALGDRFGGRAAYAHEIAGLVATLCNPEAGWCTGSLVSANGGLSFSY